MTEVDLIRHRGRVRRNARAARIAAGHGAKVMVAEEDRIGGTCVIRGCVPKKLFVYASRFTDEFREAAGASAGCVRSNGFDWPKLRDAVQAEVTPPLRPLPQGLDGAARALSRAGPWWRMRTRCGS